MWAATIGCLRQDVSTDGEDGDLQMRLADTQNPLPAVIAAAIEGVFAAGAGGLMLLSDSRKMEPDLYVYVVLMLAAGVVVGAAMAWRWHRESSGRTAGLGSVVRIGVIPLAAAVLVLWRSPTVAEVANGLILVGAFGGGLAVGFGLLAQVWQPDRATSEK